MQLRLKVAKASSQARSTTRCLPMDPWAGLHARLSPSQTFCIHILQTGSHLCARYPPMSSRVMNIRHRISAASSLFWICGQASKPMQPAARKHVFWAHALWNSTDALLAPACTNWLAGTWSKQHRSCTEGRPSCNAAAAAVAAPAILQTYGYKRHMFRRARTDVKTKEQCQLGSLQGKVEVRRTAACRGQPEYM